MKLIITPEVEKKYPAEESLQRVNPKLRRRPPLGRPWSPESAAETEQEDEQEHRGDIGEDGPFGG